MPVICGICVKECHPGDKNVIKCSGLCSAVFHVQCIKTDGVTTRTNLKDFKCNDCKRDNPTSVSSNASSSLTTTVTKEFLISVLESFKQEVSGELKQYSEQFEEFRTSVQFLSDNIDKSNDLTAKLREEYAAMRKENEHLQEQNKKLNETVTDLRIRDVGRAMGQELVEAQVSAVHRVPTYKADRTPSIVVQFTGRMQRDAWITAFKKKKTLTASEINPIFPKQQAVYVNEHLSPENKQLLGQLKKKCSEKNVKFVWVKEGKFFVRKKEGEKCHKQWRVVNKLTGAIGNTKFDKVVLEDGSIIEDPLLIANEINSYLANVYSVADNIIGNDPALNVSFVNQMQSFFISPVDKTELESVIRKLKNKKSTGYDGINVELVKKIALFNRPGPASESGQSLECASYCKSRSPTRLSHLG
ncbi:polycystic kidney disease protein 1-like [Homalodisca vitripennis]|nr:polycystic kidney disease protein 1-like [Homalodisca vitripennis]